MGGGSHYPDSEVDDRPTVTKDSVSGTKTSHGRQRHGHMNRDLGDAYSNIGSTKQHRDHGFERNTHHDDMHPCATSVATGAQGGRDFDLPKPRNIRTEGRQPGGPGRGSQRPVVEADNASTGRHLPRLGVESREGARMPRGIRPSSHYNDLADFAGEEFNYQLRGSHRGHPYPPSGHGHHPSRRANDGMTPPWHQYYAAEMSEYQPRGYRRGPHLPPAGHGHSGSHARHFVGR